MPIPAALEGPSGTGGVAPSSPPTDLGDLLPGNLGPFLEGFLDGAERTARIDRDRVKALILEMIERVGPIRFYEYYLGGMGLSFDAVKDSVVSLVEAISELSMWEIANLMVELPGRALDALDQARLLLTEPSMAGLARELGDAMGESLGEEIDFAATSPRHLMQQMGRVAGTILVEVWIGAITMGAGNAVLATRWGRRLANTAESVWDRVKALPGGGRRNRHRGELEDKGTSTDDRGTGDKGVSNDSRGAKPADKGSGGDGAKTDPTGEQTTALVPVKKEVSRPESLDDDPDLEAWEQDFRREQAKARKWSRGDPKDDIQPEIRRPQRFRDGDDRFDAPPVRHRFAEAKNEFTSLLNGVFGENARHPRRWKKDGDETKHYETWKKATKELEEWRKEMLELIPPDMILDPTVPAHRKRLRKIAELRKKARVSAGKKYSVFQTRFWRQAWDNEWVRAWLLKPAFEAGSPLAKKVAGKTAKEVWEDDDLRNTILERLWGLRWEKRAQAPKSRVVRQKGREIQLVEWVPLELDHLVRQADNPFLALDHRNLSVTTSLENQRMMEGLRRLSRESTTDIGAVESGGLRASSQEDRIIEQFLLANRDALKAVMKNELGQAVQEASGSGK